jgi:phosphatidate cytidylyltransferase
LVVGAGCLPVFEPLLGAAPRPYSLGHLGWPAVALAVSVALAFLGEMVRFERPGQAVVNVALAFFAIAYVGFLVTFLVALRLFHSNEWGMLAVVSAIAVTKMSDTGAYTWGRLLGRHKMTPILSPKKTIEGGIGGLLTAAVSAWLFFIVFVPLWAGAAAPVPAGWRCGLYGLIVGAAGTCGDLCESLLKRDLERKDSSRWMPGLGGVLDVLDSLLLAAPAAFFCWAAGLLGPS